MHGMRTKEYSVGESARCGECAGYSGYASAFRIGPENSFTYENRLDMQGVSRAACPHCVQCCKPKSEIYPVSNFSPIISIRRSCSGRTIGATMAFVTRVSPSRGAMSAGEAKPSATAFSKLHRS